MDRRRTPMLPFGSPLHEPMSFSAFLRTLLVRPGTASREPMSRRSSAEIINATLVEVFLAFLFVVLALAWATDGQLKAEQKKTDQLRNENEASKGAAAKAQAERDAAKAEKDKLEERFWSQFPPACKTPEPELRHFLVVTLAG